jgi:hypothetical protein
MPFSVQAATTFNFQQSHSNHRVTLRCILGLPFSSSGMPHESKNAYGQNDDELQFALDKHMNQHLC